MHTSVVGGVVTRNNLLPCHKFNFTVVPLLLICPAFKLGLTFSNFLKQIAIESRCWNLQHLLLARCYVLREVIWKATRCGRDYRHNLFIPPFTSRLSCWLFVQARTAILYFSSPGKVKISSKFCQAVCAQLNRQHLHFIWPNYDGDWSTKTG